MNGFYQKLFPTTFVMAVCALVFAVSCTKSVDLMADCHQESVVESQFSVSETEAISMLSKDLDAIYGEGDRTRAASARRIKNIKGVKFNRALSTRGASMPDDVSNLLYVVEFEDGQGSAVLGADKRVEPVFAILDRTVLTAEDIENAMSFDADRNDLTPFVAGMIYSSAMSQLETNATALPPVDIKTTRYETRYDTIGYEKKLPLLNTKWHQRDPFNMNYDYNSQYNSRYPAGCGVIAGTQIMQYHQRPNPLVIDGQTFLWNSVNKFVYNSQVIPSDADSVILGGFIYAVGKKMKMNQHVNESIGLATGVATDNAIKAFRGLGYTVSKELNYETSSIIIEIVNNRPVYTVGYTGNNLGHAWVIDGLLRYTVKEWLYEIETDPRKIPAGSDGVVNKTLVNTTSVGRLHCNYGWGGRCDGYYSYGVFDTSAYLASEWVEKSDGDRLGKENYFFDRKLSYFTVNVVQ